MVSSAIANGLKLLITACIGLLAGFVLLIVLPVISQNPLFLVAFPVALGGLVFVVVNPRLCLAALLLGRCSVDQLLQTTSIGFLGANFTFGAVINLVLLLVGLLLIIQHIQGLQGTPSLRPWIFFLVAGFASILFSPFPVPSLKLWLNILSYAVMFILAWIVADNTHERRFWLNLIVISAVVPVLYGDMEAVFFARDYFDAGKRVRGTFDHPNIFAYYLVLALWAIVFRLRNSQSGLSKLVRRLLWLLAGNVLVLLLMTKTRSAWVGCWVSFFLFALLRERRWLWAVCAAPFLALAYPPVFARVREMVTGETSTGSGVNSWVWRVNLWKASLVEVFKRPVFGHGLGSFLPLSIDFSPDRYNFGAHNAFLELAFEMGFVGLISFVAILSRLLTSAFRGITAPGLTGFAAALAFAVLSAYALQGFSDNMLQYLSFNWYLWFFVGLLFRYFLSQPETPSDLSAGYE